MIDNIVGKITVESENKKAIFEFSNNGKVNLNFEPKLDLKDNSTGSTFVKNISSLILEQLQG